jgi:hypothetical protein
VHSKSSTHVPLARESLTSGCVGQQKARISQSVDLSVKRFQTLRVHQPLKTALSTTAP